MKTIVFFVFSTIFLCVEGKLSCETRFKLFGLSDPDYYYRHVAFGLRSMNEKDLKRFFKPAIAEKSAKVLLQKLISKPIQKEVDSRTIITSQIPMSDTILLSNNLHHILMHEVIY